MYYNVLCRLFLSNNNVTAKKPLRARGLGAAQQKKINAHNIIIQ